MRFHPVTRNHSPYLAGGAVVICVMNAVVKSGLNDVMVSLLAGQPAMLLFIGFKTDGFVTYAPMLIHIGRTNPKIPPARAP